MKLLGFLEPDTIIPSLSAHTAEEVVRELVEAVVASGGIAEGNKGPVIEAVLDRERQGSTGIGGGIALPHTKECPFVEETVGAFGRSESGVQFGAVDGSAVHLFFMIISPKGSNDPPRVLKKLAQFSREDHFIRFLKDSKTQPDIIAVIEEMAHPESQD